MEENRYSTKTSLFKNFIMHWKAKNRQLINQNNSDWRPILSFSLEFDYGSIHFIFKAIESFLYFKCWSVKIKLKFLVFNLKILCLKVES